MKERVERERKLSATEAGRGKREGQNGNWGHPWWVGNMLCGGCYTLYD